MVEKHKIIPGIRKANYSINMIAVYAQVFCISLMSVLIFSDVAMRFLFAKPIPGAAELVGFMMTIVGFLGLGICTLDRSHLSIDIFVGKLSPRAQTINDIVNSLLVVLMGGIMAYAGFRQGMTVLGYGTKATLTKMYVYPFYWCMALGYAFLCLAAISNLLDGIVHLKEMGKAVKKI